MLLYWFKSNLNKIRSIIISTCPIPSASSTSQLWQKERQEILRRQPLSARSSLSFTMMSSPKPLKTSRCSAQVRRDMATRVHFSTEWSLNSCSREEISPTSTAPEADQSTGKSSKMRTSRRNTTALDFSQWPMPDPTQMALSSSSPLLSPTGLMESTSFLERWLKEWTLSKK